MKALAISAAVVLITTVTLGVIFQLGWCGAIAVLSFFTMFYAIGAESEQAR